MANNFASRTNGHHANSAAGSGFSRLLIDFLYVAHLLLTTWRSTNPNQERLSDDDDGNGCCDCDVDSSAGAKKLNALHLASPTSTLDNFHHALMTDECFVLSCCNYCSLLFACVLPGWMACCVSPRAHGVTRTHTDTRTEARTKTEQCR